MKWKTLPHIPEGKRLTAKEQAEVKEQMIEQCIEENKYYCPLCGRRFSSLVVKRQLQKNKFTSPIALDHDHHTGHIRGLLCTSCNKVEGVVSKAITTWGATHRDNTVQYLRNLADYLESEPSVYLHSSHRTPEEKIIQQKKRRQRKAKAKKDK